MLVNIFKKMDDGLLSLKWNNHKTTFFEILKLLRDNANYTDATLAVDGKFYPVHKLVLSTCSEYFSEIFERTPCKSPVIVLKDVRSQDLESLLDYMYLGEVNVNQNDLALLLKTAECLRIKGLAVPDEDPVTRHSTSTTRKFNSLENSRDTNPPVKRRKEDTSAPLSLPSPNRTSPCIQPSPNILITQKQSSSRPNSPQDDTEITSVKLEIDKDNEEDEDEAFPSDTNYDSNNEMDKEYDGDKPDVKSPARFSNTNYPVTSSQSGDLSWEDGENSFPPDSYSGDASNQQGGGEWDGLKPSALIPLVQLHQEEITYIPSSTPPPGTQYFLEKPPLPCLICGKQFGQPYNLRRHLTTHTGERPYQCPYCNYRASQNVHLEKHIRRIHLNVIVNNNPQHINQWQPQPTAVTP